jgi:hypothetical protein
VLIGLSQGVGELAILFYVISYYLISDNLYDMHQVLVELPQGVGGLAIFFSFLLVYFHNTHQVLGGLP